MKRTHLSVGVRDLGWLKARYKAQGLRRTFRTKHDTKCGTVVDATKATDDPHKVDCRLCRKAAGLPDEQPRRTSTLDQLDVFVLPDGLNAEVRSGSSVRTGIRCTWTSVLLTIERNPLMRVRIHVVNPEPCARCGSFTPCGCYGDFPGYEG